MFDIRTYRSRLTIYIILLVVFLTTILVYSYRSSREILFSQAETNITNMVQLLNGHLESHKNDLLLHAKTIRDDIQFQEYMFIVVNVNSEVEPLIKLYKNHFTWLPEHSGVLIDKNGKVLIGNEHSNLVKAIKPRMYDEESSAFTYYGNEGLKLVAISPIKYRDNKLGAFAISQTLDKRWLAKMKKQSGGELFVVQSGIILHSTLPESIGQPFILSQDTVLLGNNMPYRVHSVSLPSSRPNIPQLWFGVSNETLTATLKEYTRLTFVMVLVGGFFILAFGFIILRDFSRPLETLMAMTGKITAGELPTMQKMTAHNEVECLSNQFADMLLSLREKQAEIDRAHKQLAEMASTDTLTGLYNRRHLQEIYPKLQAQVERDGKELTIILTDIDYFKRINDRYGHPCGDEWLIHFSSLMRGQSRVNDFLFRMGGEEFLIMCMNEDIPGGLALAEKIRATTENNPIKYEGHTIHTTVSCGISSTTSGTLDLNTLLSRADEAMYEAKNSGRNQVKVWSPTAIPKTGHGT